MSALINLALSFALLSILAVGGGTAVLPEMQTVLAQQFGINHTQFVHIYSIGQLAPGPNMLMVLVIGYQIAGLIGAGVVLLSFFLPSSFLCFYVAVCGIVLGKILGDVPFKMHWNLFQSASWLPESMLWARLLL